ncbi:MAG: helix-turn-helix domain-containing protein [Pelagibacterium sp.]|uniref:IclR family transcriptional regulator n=1 Tax=Pelagibacterium sp. TaxID=1967288 RepID=UPI0032ECF107
MGESTIGRAFQILDMLGEQHSTITPDDVGDALGTTRSTTYRYIKELCDTGFLMQLTRGVYALGPRIVELERKIQLSDPLLNCSRPLMKEHVQLFPDSVLILCGLWGDRVLCLHQETAPSSNGHPPLIRRARGIPFPLFKGAASLSILANLSLPKRRAIFLQYSDKIADAGLGGSWDEFRRNTRALKAERAVVTSGTFGSDLSAVAAPILDPDGNAFGSITRILARKDNIDHDAIASDVSDLAASVQTRLSMQLAASPASRIQSV